MPVHRQARNFRRQISRPKSVDTALAPSCRAEWQTGNQFQESSFAKSFPTRHSSRSANFLSSGIAAPAAILDNVVLGSL